VKAKDVAMALCRTAVDSSDYEVGMLWRSNCSYRAPLDTGDVQNVLKWLEQPGRNSTAADEDPPVANGE
jgi:hypothetical protein